MASLMYRRKEGALGSKFGTERFAPLQSVPLLPATIGSHARRTRPASGFGNRFGSMVGLCPEPGELASPWAEPDIPDAAWLARVQSGDEEAAGALIERLYPTILKTVRCHLPRRTSEEDLVQVIFSRIFLHLGQFSGTVPIEHWVSRIAVNTCINQLKHEMVRRELRMSDLTEEEEAVVQRLASTTEELPGDHSAAARELIENLLARLKPDERLVITLLYLEERSVKEVSRLTGWSASSVKVKAFRCRHKMRKLWKTLLNGQRC